MSNSFALIDKNKYTKDELNKYTNEELIKLIQECNQDIHWELLWIKTQNTVYKVYHDTVNAYYKDTIADDIISILIQGWIHAVRSYDENKATDVFFKYAIYIIRQQYFKFTRRIKENHEGKSIRHELLSDVKISQSKKDLNKGTDFIIDNILEDKDSSQDFYDIEIRDYLEYELEKLKKRYPESYECIIESVYNNKTLRTIAKERNKSPQRICDIIKRGYEFLRMNMNKEDLL